MAEVNERVRQWVNRRLTIESGAEMPLDRAFLNCACPVPRKEFRWHVEKSLPDGATTERRRDEVYIVGATDRYPQSTEENDT